MRVRSTPWCRERPVAACHVLLSNEASQAKVANTSCTNACSGTRARCGFRPSCPSAMLSSPAIHQAMRKATQACSDRKSRTRLPVEAASVCPTLYVRTKLAAAVGVVVEQHLQGPAAQQRDLHKGLHDLGSQGALRPRDRWRHERKRSKPLPIGFTICQGQCGPGVGVRNQQRLEVAIPPARQVPHGHDRAQVIQLQQTTVVALG